MIKVYVRNNTIENADGETVTESSATVRAARSGKVTTGLIAALREMGNGPAIDEEIVIEVKD